MISSVRRWSVALFTAAALHHTLAQAAPEPLPAGAIAQELRNFRSLGSVLYIAAHPDDENTRLIAYFARERGYRTAYLSLTRGDGGQNLIGPELRDELGVIRTHELLAARRIDGGRQFFTRANDFGFSKDYAETLRVWDREQVLADMVRVIRTFRPDVLVTRFSPQPGTTHGHHTASAVLALEAFKLSGDPKAFPEQLATLQPWQPRRVLWNNTSFGGGAPRDPSLRIDSGVFNPLLGVSYGEIAALSRTEHKSQAMGTLASRGTTFDYFTVLAGEPATTDLMDGVATSWDRLPGGEAIGPLIEAVYANFKTQDPAASVPSLLEIRQQLAALPTDALITDKRAQLDRIILACAGVYWETVADKAEVVPGEVISLKHNLIVRSAVPVKFVAVRYPSLKTETAVGETLSANQLLSTASSQTLPVDTAVTQPYWLRTPGTTGLFAVEDPALIGLPENPPILPVEQIIEIAGQNFALADEPVQIIRDPVKGEIRLALKAIPSVSLNFTENLLLLAPGESHAVEVALTAARPSLSGSLHLETPAGWIISPAKQPFQLATAGDRARVTFTVTAPASATTVQLTAVADIGGVSFRNRRKEITYDHIPPQLLQPAAQLKAIAIKLEKRGEKIGYLPGAGDVTAEAIARMGYSVTQLDSADLTLARLQTFDAVVIGVRAFNTRTDLAAHLPALFAYVEAGGTIVAQYNTPNGLRTPTLAPYSLRLSQDRVTDENSAVTFLAPDHPVLNTPNKITSADFEGWVQERGLYFPNQWDPAFTPILAWADAGEKPLNGALLVAKHGKGYFVYTGISFFRELPEGVPGAYRLFANLLSLGK